MIVFLKKYKVYIYILLFLVLLLVAGLMLKNFLYPDDLKSIYGSRLNGIEEVALNKTRQNEIKNMYVKEEIVESVNLDIKGKIINLIIRGKDGYTIEIAKKELLESLIGFSEKERDFYDIQFFITNELLNYRMIGYKNKTSEIIVWSEFSEVVDENQKEQ